MRLLLSLSLLWLFMSACGPTSNESDVGTESAETDDGDVADSDDDLLEPADGFDDCVQLGAELEDACGSEVAASLGDPADTCLLDPTLAFYTCVLESADPCADETFQDCYPEEWEE